MDPDHQVDHRFDLRRLLLSKDDRILFTRDQGGNAVSVEYVVFADEGHGFTKKKNQIEGYSAVQKFLDTHLKG